jgi:hypothetical protein
MLDNENLDENGNLLGDLFGNLLGKRAPGGFADISGLNG